MTRKTLTISGMSCDHCVEHVRTALEALDGVDEAQVSLEEARAVVTARDDIDERALTAAVTDAGYEARVT